MASKARAESIDSIERLPNPRQRQRLELPHQGADGFTQLSMKMEENQPGDI